MFRIWLSVLALLGLIGAMAWATDFITLQGECTVYTVSCKDGAWEGNSCSGSLVPSERVRFRALKLHREVLHWVLGSTQPSGRYSNCEIEDGRNWVCPAASQTSQTITLGLSHGDPMTTAAASSSLAAMSAAAAASAVTAPAATASSKPASPGASNAGQTTAAPMAASSPTPAAATATATATVPLASQEPANLRTVHKLRWLLLRWGLPAGHWAGAPTT